MRSESGNVIIRSKDQQVVDFLKRNSAEMAVQSIRDSASLLDIKGVSEEIWDYCEEVEPFVEADFWVGECLFLEVSDDWVSFVKLLATSSKLDVWASLWSDYEILYFASFDNTTYEKTVDTESGESDDEFEAEWYSFLPKEVVEMYEENEREQEASREAAKNRTRTYRLADMPGFEEWKKEKLSNGGSEKAINMITNAKVIIVPEEVFPDIKKFFDGEYDSAVEADEGLDD